MADVITRLKLESGEYDSKVKRATQGLLQMVGVSQWQENSPTILTKERSNMYKALVQCKPSAPPFAVSWELRNLQNGCVYNTTD